MLCPARRCVQGWLVICLLALPPAAQTSGRSQAHLLELESEPVKQCSPYVCREGVRLAVDALRTHVGDRPNVCVALQVYESIC